MKFTRPAWRLSARATLHVAVAGAMVASAAAAGLGAVAQADAPPSPSSLFFDGFENGLSQWSHVGDATNSGLFSWDGAYSESPDVYHCGGGSQTESVKVLVSPNTTYYLHLAYLTQVAAGEGGYVATYQYDSNGNRLSETWVLGYQGGGVPATSRLPLTTNTWGSYTVPFTTGPSTTAVTVAPEDWPGSNQNLCNAAVPAGHRVFFDDVEVTTGPASAHAAPTFDLNTLGVGSLASLSLHVAADDIRQSSGVQVASWPDSSGNSNDLYAHGTPPTLVSGVFNGHAVMQFNGPAPDMTSAKNMQGGNAPYDVFVVARPKVGGGYFGWGAAGNPGHEVALRTMSGPAGLDTYWWAYDDYQGAAPVSLTSPNVIESFYNGTNRGMSLNGATLSSFAGSGKSTDVTSFRLGSSNLSGLQAPEPFSGQIAEALVYQGALTTCQRANVTAYLSQKYLGKAGAARCAPPQVTVTGVTAGASYEHGAVSPQCAANSISGTSQFPATVTLSGSRSADGLGSATASCSYTDLQGLTQSATAAYTVVDTTPPTLTVPANQQAEATGPAGATVSYPAVSAIDTVDGAVIPTCSAATDSTFPVGMTTVTCTATDKAGNTGTATFHITVADTTAPALNLPASFTATATATNTPVAFAVPDATDLVDGAQPTACDVASGVGLPRGTTTVHCTATDKAGNVAQGSFAVTVQDAAAPVLSLPDNVTAEATSASGAPAAFAVTASDDIDGTRPVTCDAASGDTFALGTHTVHCSAADTVGNVGHGSFTITVVDSTPPTVTVPDAITTEAANSLGAVVHYTATASDIVDGNLTPWCSAADGDQLPMGKSLVTCTGTDAAGNTATKSFTVDVVDSTAPTVTAPADVTMEATGPDGAPANFSGGSASDAVDGPADAVTCTPASGTTFPVGSTTVQCSATDAAGNTGHATFKVTVADTTAPALTLPANQVLEAIGAGGAPATFSASASDLVDGAVVATCNRASGSTFPLGTTTVQCTAADSSHNTSTGSFTVKVQDTTAPVVTVPSNLTAEASSSAGATVSYPPATARDTVDGDLKATCAPASGATFPLGTTKVTCAATDSDSNVGTNFFTVTVTDTTGPVLDVPDNITATASSAAGATVSYSPASASDLVDQTDPASCDHKSGTPFGLGTTTVTCSATDHAGNTTAKTFTVTVAYAWSGLQNPFVPGASYKLGRTIPLKFTLTGTSATITNAVVKIYAAKVTGSTGGPDAPAASTSAASSGNTFRNTGSSYIFNLDTKGMSTGTWQLKLDFGDGAPRTSTFVLN